MQDSSTWPSPGTIIGYLDSGRPVRLQAGGSETATEAPPAEPAAPAAPPAAPPAPQQPAAPRVPPGQPEGGQFAPAAQPAPLTQPAAPVPAAPSQPDWQAQLEAARAETEALKADRDRWKQHSRKEEQRSKANHAQAKGLEGVVRQIAEKLEIPFDDTPDPEEVSRALTAAQTEARQLKIERAIYLNAARSGADANALLDSREFIARAGQVDPEASDFADQVGDLVKEAAREARYQVQQPPNPLTPQVTQQPAQQQPAAQFQQPPPQQQAPAQPPAPSSGADFSGAPGGNRLWTQADYDYWATGPGKAQDRDGKIMAKAIQDGLLVNLGVGKPRRAARR